VVTDGVEATMSAARTAAAEALIDVATRLGRQEYRVTVAGRETIVIPGLDEDGVDLIALRGALDQLVE
jgi:hypothetical protein